MSLGARADKLSGQLDHVTITGFNGGVTLKEDDSMVLVLADFLTAEE
jgi:hypothetical protein